MEMKPSWESVRYQYGEHTYGLMLEPVG
jgi:hypothetical protein